MLYENNMYLLFPLKIFELRKRIYGHGKSQRSSCNNDKLKSDIIDDILELVNNIFKYVDNVFLENKITIEDYNDFCIIVENLCEHLNYELDRYGELEKEVMILVKTFYDKRVEERGIEKGIEKGIEISRKSKREFVKNLLLKGASKEVILESGDFNVDEIDEILLEIKN